MAKLCLVGNLQQNKLDLQSQGICVFTQHNEMIDVKFSLIKDDYFVVWWEFKEFLWLEKFHLTLQIKLSYKVFFYFRKQWKVLEYFERILKLKYDRNVGFIINLSQVNKNSTNIVNDKIKGLHIFIYNIRKR